MVDLFQRVNGNWGPIVGEKRIWITKDEWRERWSSLWIIYTESELWKQDLLHIYMWSKFLKKRKKEALIFEVFLKRDKILTTLPHLKFLLKWKDSLIIWALNIGITPFCCWVYALTKSNLVGKSDLFGLQFLVPIHHGGKSNQELKQ